MVLPRGLKKHLRRDRERIELILDGMIAKIANVNPQEAESARLYWYAHIKSSLHNAYGGLGVSIDKD